MGIRATAGSGMKTMNSNDDREWVRRCQEVLNSGVKQHPMVGWYDLGRLFRTAINIVISSVLGTRSDVRWMEAQPGKVDVIEYGDTSENGEFWFDYMADTGDGWNSTFRMAYLLARPQLVIQSHKLRRGSFLILGGDEVYPCASRQLYRERLVNPFWHACPRSLPPDPRDDQAHLYAIPGNHDWYDGLVSFMRQFLQGRNIGIWRTRQSRSYFALKLPHNWWIWGLDTQLESDIDWPQVQFFIKAADRMGNQGNNLIVCTAEPYWIYANLYEEKESKRQLYNNLLFLMSEEVLGPKKVNLYLSLAGDLHHYRRHVDVCDQNRHRMCLVEGERFFTLHTIVAWRAIT